MRGELTMETIEKKTAPAESPETERENVHIPIRVKKDDKEVSL